MISVDAVVAGAGIWGCTIAHRLAQSGKKVLVLEKRLGVGGNVRCETDQETGIEVHTYGSHIFHTHNSGVWEFVNRFVSFNGYQHKVLANYHGKTYHLPLGLTLINKFFGVELHPGEVAEFMAEERHSADIFDAFFRGYTCKQWGVSPEEIDPSIIKRVPVRSNYDTNYFNDYNQGIPLTGYNSLFDHLLDHPNITVETEMTVKMEGSDLWATRNSDSTQPPLEINFGRLGDCLLQVYYSGPIDALFNYKFGALPWRTLRFERETMSVPDYQGTAVVNYTAVEVPYTRIHEFKHYHPEKIEVDVGDGERKLVSTWGFDAAKTIIMREYSATWKQGDEPYYPIENAVSQELLRHYQSEVVKFNMNPKAVNYSMIVGGRLGGYKYYDMDKSIEAALKVKV